jgi:hypothetical protein
MVMDERKKPERGAAEAHARTSGAALFRPAKLRD